MSQDILGDKTRQVGQQLLSVPAFLGRAYSGEQLFVLEHNTGLAGYGIVGSGP